MTNITLKNLTISSNNDFDAWLNIIYNIIRHLKNLNEDVNGENEPGGLQSFNIASIITGAIDRSQITELITNRTSDLGYDYNNYYYNGVYYIPYTNDTINQPVELPVDSNSQPVPVKKDCYLYVAAKNSTNVAQFAIDNSANIYTRTKKNSDNWSDWTVFATKSYVTTNFLSKTTTNSQNVAGQVTFTTTSTTVPYYGIILENSGICVNSDSMFKGKLYLKKDNQKGIVFNTGTTFKSIIDDNDNIKSIIEVVNNNDTLSLPKPNNYPLEIYNNRYKITTSDLSSHTTPLTIDHGTAICNINGTANYANYLNPSNMRDTYNGTTYYPISQKAVHDLYLFSLDTFAKKTGDSFTGIINHYEDIFLRHIQSGTEHRTAALRSPDGQLNLQCQSVTNLISTSKQCELYLEKEDVDANEYTKNEVSFAFDFYTVVWNYGEIIDQNKNYTVTRETNKITIKDAENINTIGNITFESDGKFVFNGTDYLQSKLNLNNTYTFKLVYNIINSLNNANISENNEYIILINLSTGIKFSGYIPINSEHYQTVFTKLEDDSNCEFLDIISDSILRPGSILLDGSVIAAGSVINGIYYNESEVVRGTRLNALSTVTNTSVLKKESQIAYASVFNGTEEFQYPFSELASSIKITTDTRLTAKSLFRTGSYLAGGSKLGTIEIFDTVYNIDDNNVNDSTGNLAGTYKSSDKSVKLNKTPNITYYINYDNTDSSVTSANIIVYEDGTQNHYIIAGTATISNKKPTELTLHKLINGCEIFTESTLAAGSKIKIGSTITAGSIINGVQYDEDTVLEIADLAPKMYIRTYSNFNGTYSNWDIHYYKKYFQNQEYNATKWKSKIKDIINSLNLSVTDKNNIISDLDYILLIDRSKNIEYHTLDTLKAPMYNGKYIALSSAPDNPIKDIQNYYNLYVYINYITTETNYINLNKIEFVIHPKTSVERKYVIYSTSTATVSPINFVESTDKFIYTDFSIKKLLNSYSITFNYMLGKSLNQFETGAELFEEYIAFKFYYGNDTSVSVYTETKKLTLNAKHMLNSSCTIGARTRNGITKEGEFGDPLYDLGCIEFGEEYTSLRLRKVNVTTLENIKSDIAIVLKRNALIPEYIQYEKQILVSNDGKEVTYGNYPYTTATNKSAMITLGVPESKFDTLYVSTATIETSDKNKKTNIKAISNKLLDAWKNVNWVSYKLKDSVEQKGKKARIHTGVIAQDLEKDLNSIDLERYGFFCIDEWDDEYETKTLTIPKHIDKNGIEIDEKKEEIRVLKREKNRQYSIRYQEMQAIENMYLRREIELLKEEIKHLKEKLIV